MKLFIIALSLAFNTAHAEIYKCETKDEKITYQQEPCNKALHQKKIVLEKFDPEKTRLAVKRLNEELKVFNAAEEIRLALEEKELEKRRRLQPQIIEIYNETFIDNVHHRDFYPKYATGHSNLKVTPPILHSPNNNPKQHFNPPGPLSRQSNMNPR